jgi:hypothetical protein
VRNKFAVVLLATLTFVAAVPFAQTAGAETFPSKITRQVGMYDCTSSSALCRAAVTTAAVGQPGRMVCWEDGRAADGQVRWFYVRLKNGRQGFVPASRVSPQTKVKSCRDRTAGREVQGIMAARAALSRNGLRDVAANDKQRLTTLYGVPLNHTLGDWSGDCIGFTNLSWDAAGVKVPLRHARQVYDQFKARGQIRTDRNPPRGALVFWNAVSGGYNYGHVEISLGNSRSIGTSGWDGQRKPVSIEAIGTTNYLGWAMP